MRWALIRAKDTGARHRVVGYLYPVTPTDLRWRYMVRKAESRG